MLLVLCSHSKNICHHELYEDIELIIKVNENIKLNFNYQGNYINIVYWYIGTSGGEMKDIH